VKGLEDNFLEGIKNETVLGLHFYLRFFLEYPLSPAQEDQLISNLRQTPEGVRNDWVEEASIVCTEIPKEQSLEMWFYFDKMHAPQMLEFFQSTGCEELLFQKSIELARRWACILRSEDLYVRYFQSNDDNITAGKLQEVRNEFRELLAYNDNFYQNVLKRKRWMI